MDELGIAVGTRSCASVRSIGLLFLIVLSRWSASVRCGPARANPNTGMPERFPTEKRAERFPTDQKEGRGLEPIAQFG